MLRILGVIIKKKCFSLKVLSIKFPSEHFLSILEILSMNLSLKMLSIKFPLKYFLLTIPVSKTKCGFKPAGTFKRPNSWL